MILVDASVWIDYFRGDATPQAQHLHDLLGLEPVAIGDLGLTEVLQGFSTQSDFDRARRLLNAVSVIEIAGKDIAIQAARHFRALRARGITVRKTIDTLIATRCIEDGHALLHRDRDFDPFVTHLGLRSVC
ncbi:MAG: PIN domain nuclease [Rhizobacter sp.]|jgi:predicted nucleic acid-binding protein